MLLFITTREVVMRYGFNSPSSWALEVLMGIQLFYGYLCAGYVLKEEEHIRIRVLIDHVSPKTRWRILTITSIMGAIFCGIMAHSSWLMVEASFRLGERTALLGFPIFWLKMILVIGFILFSLQFIANIHKYYQELKVSPEEKV